jgi:DNA-binding transcriptional LysR family regulator
MEMQQVKYFLAVCETLNFTQAALMSNVTQPALTRAIQKLEEEFGGLLFRRERKLTHLTDLGHLIRPQLEVIFRQTQLAKSTAESFVQLKDAPLKIGVMCTVGPMRFVGFLSGFGRAHKGVELSLQEATPERLYESLVAGELDLAIMVPPEDPTERIEILPLYEERFVVAYPVGHRFDELDEVPLSEVANESYLLRVNCEMAEQFEQILTERDILLGDVYKSEREDWIQSMVIAGMGICFLPEFSPVIPGLRVRPLTAPEVVRKICLVTVAGRRYSPAVAVFIRAIKDFAWPNKAVRGQKTGVELTLVTS